MNTNRLIVAAGAIAYVAALLAVWRGEELADHSPFLYINIAYAALLLGGSYLSQRVRDWMPALMTVAIASIQTHALYLVWITDISPTMVIASFTIVLAPVATFGHTFRSQAALVAFVSLSALPVIAIAIAVDSPRTNPVVFVVGYLALGLVCFIATRSQLRGLERLRKNAEHRRALVDAIPDVLATLDENGAVVELSVGDESPIAILLASGALNLSEPTKQALSSATIQTFEVSPPADGDQLSLEVRIVKSGDGEATAIIRDITDEKAIKSRLMVADRMAALGTLSVGIGHEINNPLTYVYSNLHFAIDALGDLLEPERRAPVVEALTDAIEGATRIKGIVEDLRKSVRHDDQSDEQANLSSALEFAVRVAGNQVRYRARLDVDIGENITVIGSEGKLSQVFLNLIVNAMQSFDSGTRERNRIEICAKKEAAGVVVEVSDNGRGIEQDIQSRIFDPFFTTKDVGQGSGLGLYVCHQIIKGCGGELALESEVGRGTTARVTLLAADALPADATAAARVDVQPTSCSILVIDDEPRILRAFSAMMREHDVTTCDDPRRGLELVTRHDYDAIFCDLMMPEMSGMELFEQVERESTAKAGRIVFITGGAFTADARRFLDAHADRHLAKPFDRAAVVEFLGRVAPSVQSP